jgi:CBS domain-containing protein
MRKKFVRQIARSLAGERQATQLQNHIQFITLQGNIMSVGRICTRSTDVTYATEPVQIAARRMLDRNVGCLIVVNARQEPIGIVTDRDLALRVLSAAKDPGTTFVGDVMTADVHTVSETTPIEDALRIMRTGPYRRVPVTDVNNVLLGVVTLDDILDLLTEEFNSIGRLLRQEAPAILASA